MADAERPTAEPRAVLYLRQSTYREESISLELQEAAARDYANRQGYRVIGVEADPGITGRTWKRPAVQRTLQMIERGEADVIVLWKWSRLSRARLDWAIAVDKVETAGGRIESATEPTDTTTSAGRLARGILAEFAAFESERIGEEWQRAIRSRQARGLPGTGGPRFGYVRVAKDVYEPDPVTGPVLAELYRRATQGETLFSLATWLNDNGIPTTAGGPWSRARLQPMLDSGFGAGLIRTNAHTPAKWEYLPGVHEPVITEEQWEAYRRYRTHKKTTPPNGAAKYPLTGLIYCGDCGARMSAVRRQNGSGRIQFGYGCSRYQRFRIGKSVSTLRPRVEGWVKAQVLELAGDLQRMEEAEAQMTRQRAATMKSAASVARDLEKVDAQLAKLTVGWTDGVVDDDAYRLAAGRLREKRDELLAREARLEQRGSGPTADARALTIGLAEAWDRMTDAELRATLAALIARVVVTPPAAGVPARRGASYTLTWAWEDASD